MHAKRVAAVIFLLLFVCVFLSGCIKTAAPAETEAAPTATAFVPVPTPASITTPEPTTTPEPKAWFLGDWAGVYAEGEEDAKKLTDFGAALADGLPKLCLLRVYETDTGFEAALGFTKWVVTEHSGEALSLRCIKGSYYIETFRPYEAFFLKEGDVLALTCAGAVESSERGARVPTAEILRGSVQGPYFPVSFLLSRLPSGAERNEESGEYPCWYGGYENMEGGFNGLFLLGKNARGRFFYGAVLEAGSYGQTVMDRSDYGYPSTYAPRDGASTDLVTRACAYDVSVPWWPRFERLFEAPELGAFEWREVTGEHDAYFANTYPAVLDALEAELKGKPQDIWTERALLLIKGFRHYAALGASGRLAPELYPLVPELVSLEREYLPEASLAGLYPNDTLEDAEKLYTLREIDAAEAQSMGFDGVYDAYRPDSPVYGYKTYTDSNGLVLTAWADGRIASVRVYKAGYQTPDGRQVGDAFSVEKRNLRIRDGELEFGRWYEDTESGKISGISMETVLDRAFSETTLNFDGDGEKEYLTLSGRCRGSYLECGTRLGNFELGTVDADDIGTKVTLRVYKNGALIDEAVLLLHMLHLTPSFHTAMQKNEPGKVWIVCGTGGNVSEQPVYLAEKTRDGWRTTFLGHLSN